MTTSTYEESPPFRPGTGDFGGSAKVNDTEFAPDPTTQPSADDWNQLVLAAASAHRMIPVAIVLITFPGGSVVSQVSSARGDLTPADFSTVDDTGSDTTLSWNTGVLPSPAHRAEASAVGTNVRSVTAKRVSDVSVQIKQSGTSDDVLVKIY